MKNLIFAMVLVLITLTGCKKSEEEITQVNKEQISTAHYKAFGVLQSLPGYLGTLGNNSTNDKGEFITTFINLSKDVWGPGDESNLANRVAALMLASDELKFEGWTIYNDNLEYSGFFVYKNVKENKSTIEIIFRLDPYISFSLNTYIR